jgi:hypothetical protein
MSASHTWFSLLTSIPLIRLGYLKKGCLLSVVFTHFRFTRQSRSLSRIRRNTFLWLMTFPSCWSCLVTRR